MDYWDSQIALNLNAAAYCSRYAVADMVGKGTEGRIVNVSSVHGRVTWVHRRMLPYSAGKAGLDMFTKALGVEVAKYGIRVNCDSPGYMQTDLIATMTDMLPVWLSKMPEGSRLGFPPDLIGAYVYFVSDASAYATGADLVVDGGYTII